MNKTLRMSSPNPETGENFPFQFKWKHGYKTLPKEYENNKFETAICSVCKVQWGVIDFLYFGVGDDWVCPDPNCQRARYFRETIEKFEKSLQSVSHDD